MKKTILFSLFLLITTAGCNDSQTPPVVVGPNGQYDISMLPQANFNKSELEELCGPGVVEGQLGENRCDFKTTIRDLMASGKTGFIYRPDWAHQKGVTFFTPAGDKAPENFDIRDLAKGGLPKIKDQAWNDCWANASTSGLELARAVGDQKGIDHSTQTTISCSGQGSAASGGYMEAFDFVKNGLPLEAEWTYAGKDLKCKYTKDELAKGFEPKLIGTPYIGSSLSHSIATVVLGSQEGKKVQNIKDAMWNWKGPVVATVAAYSISGNSVYSSCSAINSGGNHMIVITGFDGPNAHVWNSWGLGHGDQGVSRIKWECGDGKLNRGLGVAAKISQYKAPCTPPPVSFEKAKYMILQGSALKLGAKQAAGVTCQWSPTDGVQDPKACETFVEPKKSTEYHLQATNTCGTSSAMTLVEVWSPVTRQPSDTVITPHGEFTTNELGLK